MSNNRKDFTLDNLKKNFEFLGELDLYKLYEALNRSWEEKIQTNFCDTAQFSELDDPDVIILLKKLFKNIDLLLKPQGSFADIITKSGEKKWIYLKYWLYDQLILNDFNQFQTNLFFNFLRKNKNGCMQAVTFKKLCNFHKLSLKDVYDIKNLCDYSELLFNADMNIYDKISENYKYLDYFKKGLHLYKSSKSRCPTDLQNEYCGEFNEYEKVHNKNKTNLHFLSCREKLLSTLKNKDTTSTGKLPPKDRTSKDTMDPEFHKLLIEDKLVDKIHLNKFYNLLETYNGGNNTNSCNFKNHYLIKDKTVICDILEHVKNILKKWDSIFEKYEGLSSNKTCDYFNYWLCEKLRHIDATPCDIEVFYILWNEYAAEQYKKGEKTCYNKEYYGFSVKELGNKKKIFDFLEYYNEIRNKLNDEKNNKKKDYCAYIKKIFELYKYIEQENVSFPYGEEIKLFQNKFLGNDELEFLEEKCPDMCLYFVFNTKFKTLCPFEGISPTTAEKENLKPCNNLESFSARGHIGGNHEKDYKISDLTTSTVYSELNGEVTKDKYYSVCSELIPYNKKHCGIYDLCSKLVKNLIKLSKMKKQYRNDRCEYVIHWIYDEIGKILNISTDNIYDTHAFRVFSNATYDVLYKLDISDCLHKTLNISFIEQKEQKNLHDYFKNYDKIHGLDSSNSNKCTKYFEYIKDMNKLYEMYISKCCYCFTSGYCKEDCPDYFKCDEKYNPYTLYEKLGCNKVDQFKGHLKKVDRPPPADKYVKLLSEISEKKAHLLNWDNKKPSLITEQVYNKETSDPFYTFALGSFGFLGVFLILFILNKFTTLGSYFNNRDAKKRKSYLENFEEQFLDDDVEFNHDNTQNRRMRIAYYQA
ncbi:PIR protein [Plasmodium ovale]|uniref:PIR protein n=1 Tax=Plasmodium ovale TaxID=36330 RepID=A0A1D3JE91_PLAOA|nr:PIR protein [Plasmodium ovale]